MRSAARKSDPAPATRRPTPAELTLIHDQLHDLETGSGWSGANIGLPSGETNSQLSPYRMRGLWPKAGYTEQMLRAEPSVYSGFDKQLLTVSSLNWEIVKPTSGTAEEIEQTRIIREGWRRLPYGFLGHAVQWPFTARLHGFSLSEKTFEIDDDTGLWMLTGLDWIPPWTVKAWILDMSGHAIAVHIRDEAGDHVIEWENLYYEGQFFWGKNYEGLGIARPIKYYWDHKAQLLVDHARASARASSGIPVAESPADANRTDPDYKTEKEEMDEVLQSILWEDEDDPARAVTPPGWGLKVMYLDELPDSTKMLDYLDNMMGIQMTDTLSQLGQSKHGARAVGAEQRMEKWSMLGGLVKVKCNNLDNSIHRQWYELNGWDTNRMCRTNVTGLGTDESSRRILEYLMAPRPADPILPMTDEILEQLDRNLGLPERGQAEDEQETEDGDQT